MTPGRTECGLFSLRKDCSNLQMVSLKWWKKKSWSHQHSWSHLDGTLWISLWKQLVKYFHSFWPRGAIVFSSLVKVSREFQSSSKASLYRLGGQVSPQLIHLGKAAVRGVMHLWGKTFQFTQVGYVLTWWDLKRSQFLNKGISLVLSWGCVYRSHILSQDFQTFHWVSL